MNFLKRFFKLQENNTTVKREVYSGTVTFLAVSYILAVNPAILGSTGMDRGGVFFVTAIAAAFGTLAMALIANYPLVLAPAMGLNAFFAYTVVSKMGYSWQFALFAVVVEGIVFFLLSVSSIREKIIDAIPMPLKYAMGAGIGMFITLIAFKNAHIIKANPETFMTIQNFCGPGFSTAGISALLTLAGVLFAAWMMHRKISGALLYCILGTWGLGIVCQLLGIYVPAPEEGFVSMLPHFNCAAFIEPLNGFCELFGSAFHVSRWTSRESGVSGLPLLFSADFLVIGFAFFFTDFFDTVGTVNGAIVNTPLMKENGKIPRMRNILLADSIATLFGGILGTSTTSTFVESTIGIRSGARTGLAALTCVMWFLLSLIFAPVFLAIPCFATAPALIIISFLMMKVIVLIDWNDITGALPAYLLIAGTVFTYNISDGLGFGIISYTILNCRIKGRVNWLMWVISLLFVLKYVCL
ncbi:MAG: NCS2 family permease [Lentisphaerae bacterium]|nr:NCS2 family permease [Lentisphaerota bacterium]